MVDFSFCDKATPKGFVNGQLELTVVDLLTSQQIENRSQRTRYAHTVHLLNVIAIDVRSVKDEDFGNRAIATEVFRHGHVQL
jgi:hypothetical protein